MKYKYNQAISKFIENFDCEVIDITCTSDYEINGNILYIWSFNNKGEDKLICELLKQNLNTDTLFIGKDVTDRNELKKIHHILSSSHNIIPIIKHIIVEDDSRFCSVDGLLIDKMTKMVLDYASGRCNKTIVIPDDIIGLEEHCFNYNEYVKEIVLPPTIKNLAGITSLPRLESVNLDNHVGAELYSNNGILYSVHSNKLYFIPPYHPSYPSLEELKIGFSTLLSWVKEEADKGRWRGVTSNCFSRDSIIEESIYLTYDGGFYEQCWGINLQLLPTWIVIYYYFNDKWNEECASSISTIDNWSGENPIKLKCEDCSSHNNCKSIYRSNEYYVSKIVSRLNAHNKLFNILDGRSIECRISIDTPIVEIFQALMQFLDIALCYRTKFPITNTPLQSSLFHEIERQGELIPNVSENLPFTYSSYSSPIGFMIGDMDHDGEIPPF